MQPLLVLEQHPAGSIEQLMGAAVGATGHCSTDEMLLFPDTTVDAEPSKSTVEYVNELLEFWHWYSDTTVSKLVSARRMVPQRAVRMTVLETVLQPSVTVS